MTLPVLLQPSKARPADHRAIAWSISSAAAARYSTNRSFRVELFGLYVAATVRSDGDTYLDVNGVVNMAGGHLPGNVEGVLLVEDVHGRVLATDDKLTDADKAYGFAAATSLSKATVHRHAVQYQERNGRTFELRSRPCRGSPARPWSRGEEGVVMVLGLRTADWQLGHYRREIGRTQPYSWVTGLWSSLLTRTSCQRNKPPVIGKFVVVHALGS